MKKVFVSLLTLMLILSLTACGDSGSQSGSGDSGEPDAEQYVNSYIETDPTTLDPSLRSDSYSSGILIDAMEGLIRLEEVDGQYTFMPGDAESWESDEAGVVWTFHLGADRKWSDGEPVTADQYVYSLRRSADPATGCPNTYFLAPIKGYNAISTGDAAVDTLGVEAVDDKTLVITLDYPMASFLESTDASIFYPQRQDIVEKYGDQYGADADKMIYNGPYVVSDWQHNSSITLTKNENYWNAGAVTLDTVNYQVLSDTSVIANAYDSNQIDLIYASSGEQKMKYESDGTSVYTKTSGGTITFQFYNVNDKLFSNKNIRKAFTLAVDQEEINEMAFEGLRLPLYGWIAPALSVEGKSMREAAGEPINDLKAELDSEGKTPKDILIEGMEELGLGSDPSTLDVTYSLAGTDDWYHNLGEYLQQRYKEQLGINLKIDFSEWGIFEDNLENGRYQIGFMGWGAYFNDPYDMLSIHVSDWNMLYTGWANSDYDKLVMDGQKEMDPEKRMSDYVEAEKILMGEYVVCPMATSVTHTFSKPYLHDSQNDYGREDGLYFVHPGWKYGFTSGR